MSRSFPLISKDKVGVIDASVDRAGRASPQAAAHLDHPATIDLPMRERLRRAMNDPGAVAGDRGSRSLAEWQVDAVLAALAEPTEAMLESAYREIGHLTGKSALEDAWKAMIAKAGGVA